MIFSSELANFLYLKRRPSQFIIGDQMRDFTSGSNGQKVYDVEWEVSVIGLHILCSLNRDKYGKPDD
jgi:hypothetical protein